MVMLALLSQATGGGWDAAGHEIGIAWLELAGRLGAGLLLVFVLFFVVRAFVRRHSYRATDVLTADDFERLHAAIATAERRTVGEIVPVVLERSDRHPGALWVAAVVFVLLGSALLGPWLPWERPPLLLLSQLVFGLVGYAVARALPDFQRIFVRQARATEMAEEQAFQEFYRHGLHRTEAQTGVLLFVSLFERRVVVLADEGVDAVTDETTWGETDAAVLEGVARGELCEGLLAGIERAADVLAEHFPWTDGDRNEVPDRIIVRRE
jgi:putative membrane protein